MKGQLTLLARLIEAMDETMYTHLESINALDLFYCYRWLLLLFKREFSYNDTLRLWEFILVDYKTKDTHIFVALAMLQSMRGVILSKETSDDVLSTLLVYKPNIERILLDTEELVERFADTHKILAGQAWSISDFV
jgi:Rab-GTPase-TBC domain